MTKAPVIVVDADAIVAQANPHDKHHQAAMAIAEKLSKVEARVITPVTAVMEAVTFIQRVLLSPAAASGTAVAFSDPNVLVVNVEQRTVLQATSKYFSPTASKKHTLYDCVVATVAEENKADAIFSFDKFYKKKGFTLASELVTSTD